MTIINKNNNTTWNVSIIRDMIFKQIWIAYISPSDVIYHKPYLLFKNFVFLRPVITKNSETFSQHISLLLDILSNIVIQCTNKTRSLTKSHTSTVTQLYPSHTSTAQALVSYIYICYYLRTTLWVIWNKCLCSTATSSLQSRTSIITSFSFEGCYYIHT